MGESNKRWDALFQRANAVVRRLKHLLRRRDLFEGQREVLLVWLTETDLQLTNLEHFTSHTNEDEKQHLVLKLMKNISEQTYQFEDLLENGQLLVEKAECSDAIEVEEKIIKLNGYCKDVLDKLDRFTKTTHVAPPSYSDVIQQDDLSDMEYRERY